MLSFVFNAIAVVVGTIIGVLFKNKIKKEICDSVLKALGVTVFLIGVVNVIKYMFVIDSSTHIIEVEGTLLMILSIAIGTFIGEFLKIDDGLNALGLKIEKKLNKGKIVEGFVTSTLMYCVGSMAIIGTFDAVQGNPDTIYLKSALDGITSIALASTLGFGVGLSSISILVYQGTLTLLFYFLGDIVPNDFLVVFNMVGYVLITALGLNLLITNKIKVANMLPALLIVIIYYVFISLL